jgi:hypothetical protein
MCVRIMYLVDGNLESEKDVYFVRCTYLIVGVVHWKERCIVEW